MPLQAGGGNLGFRSADFGLGIVEDKGLDGFGVGEVGFLGYDFESICFFGGFFVSVWV